MQRLLLLRNALFMNRFRRVLLLLAGTAYPPTFITTADTDDRVVPSHSYKFAAALQQAQAGEAPILLRVETDTGHGGGTPTSKEIGEFTDVFSFLIEALNLDAPARSPASPSSDGR